MLSGGMVGRFLRATMWKPFPCENMDYLAPIGAGLRVFFVLRLFRARRSDRLPFFRPSLAVGSSSPKKKGYTGPAPSSGLVNRPNGRLSNQSWVLAVLLRRQCYVSVGGVRITSLPLCTTGFTNVSGTGIHYWTWKWDPA